jgi:hypothetical protein
MADIPNIRRVANILLRQHGDSESQAKLQQPFDGLMQSNRPRSSA